LPHAVQVYEVAEASTLWRVAHDGQLTVGIGPLYRVIRRRRRDT
jgi:hypothetical protein